MLFFGHIGITAFIASMMFLPASGGVIGVLLPDIIDKGLFILGYAPCSRFIAHSIFFPLIAGLISYGVTRNKKFALAVAIGYALHLFQDLNGNVPFLFPLKSYAYFATCATKISVVFTPFVIATELIGISLLIFIFVFKDKYQKLRETFWKLMRGFA